MLKVIPPRLRKPLLYTLAGLVFAAAWLIHGGRTWWFSIVVLVVTAARVLAVYLRAGKDTDEGALAGIFAWTATFVALSVAVAAGQTWWPYAAILAVAGFGYLFGLSSYGVGEQDPAEEDSDAGCDAPSPVTS